MKKIVFSLVLFLTFSISNAQKDFQGMAVYESKTSTADFKKRFEGNKDITPEMAKMIEDRMKKMSEKTFVLNFDRNTSIYKEEEKLDAPGTQGGGMRMMGSMMGGGGTFYKNIKEKAYLIDKEFMGKEFLVKDSLKTIQWKMEGETREIGGYMCMKATAVLPASKTDFRNFRPKEKKEGEKQEGKKTNFMADIELPKDINVTAWYTPEIPVSQGPESYWGLPGLILEVNDGKTTIVCSKVVMNIKEKAEIKAPTKGKEISQKDYDEVVTAKMKEMMEMNQGRNGGMQIRMGR
jgi:GLPGLI family protein